jgi:hypothetical protein
MRRAVEDRGRAREDHRRVRRLGRLAQTLDQPPLGGRQPRERRVGELGRGEHRERRQGIRAAARLVGGRDHPRLDRLRPDHERYATTRKRSTRDQVDAASAMWA